jgi:hypothetical protein
MFFQDGVMFFSKPSGSLYPAVHSTHEAMTDEQSSGSNISLSLNSRLDWAKERMLLKSMYHCMYTGTVVYW